MHSMGMTTAKPSTTVKQSSLSLFSPLQSVITFTGRVVTAITLKLSSSSSKREKKHPRQQDESQSSIFNFNINASYTISFVREGNMEIKAIISPQKK